MEEPEEVEPDEVEPDEEEPDEVEPDEVETDAEEPDEVVTETEEPEEEEPVEETDTVTEAQAVEARSEHRVAYSVERPEHVVTLLKALRLVVQLAYEAYAVLMLKAVVLHAVL